MKRQKISELSSFCRLLLKWRTQRKDGVPHQEQHPLLTCSKKTSSSATVAPRKTIPLHQNDGNSDLLRFNSKVPLLMVSILIMFLHNVTQ
jgi:hypothetical protein